MHSLISMNYKIGELDKDGYKIIKIYANSPNYIVYRTIDGIRQYYIAIEPYKTRANKIAGLLSEINSLQTGILLNNEGINRNISYAISLCLEGDDDKANTILRSTKLRILNLRTQIGRVEYLISCFSFLFINIIISILVHFTIILVDVSVKTLLYGLTVGSIGGFLSIVIKLNKLEIDFDSPKRIYFLWGVSRIFLSMITTFIAFTMIKANIFMGILNENNYTWSLYCLLIIAGYSEQFIPNLLKKIENKYTKEINGV